MSSVVDGLHIAGAQIAVAGLSGCIAYKRPLVSDEAKIYAVCALGFAAAQIPTIVGTSDTEVGRKFFQTMAEFTNIGFFSIVALRFVSQKELAFNAIGAALAVIAIVAALDVYVKQMLDLVDFAAVTILGLTAVVADQGKTPRATAALVIATGLYGVVQLPWTAYEKTEWFPLLISASSLAFSLCLLIVMYNRTDSTVLSPVGRYPEALKVT